MTSQLETLCAEHGITIDSKHLFFDDSTQWGHDRWNVTLRCAGRSATFEYRTGSGHRILPRTAKRERGGIYFNVSGEWVPENEAHISGRTKLTAPKAADVLNCLLSDASATEQTFEDWCSELGMNSDSIKDLETYRLCQTNGSKVKALLGPLFNTLRNAEQWQT